MPYTDDLSLPVPPDPHPGEMLREEWLVPLGITPYRLAKETGMTPTRVSQILAGKRGISAETALRLSRYLGCSPEFWMNLQSRYELRRMRRELAETLEEITPYPRPDLDAQMAALAFDVEDPVRQAA